MKRWTKVEEKYLQKSYPSNIPIEDICKKLGRSYDSIMKKAQRMFLKRENINKTNKEDFFLIDWRSIDKCIFFVEKHKSTLKDKLFTTLNK